MPINKDSMRGELLVAILKEKSDFAILQNEGWYRIPVDKAPRRWPPKWLAFYHPKKFGADAFCVRYFGEVGDIRKVPRRELFPNEFPNSKSDRLYHRIELKSLEERSTPIPSPRPRRLVFVPTTWSKFELAEQINDLFDDSPLEDSVWEELKRRKIRAERQWGLQTKEHYYQLDFAFFCTEGPIDVEADGDTWHAQVDRIPLDNERDNCLQTNGWGVLRFNGLQIREQPEYYIATIQENINRLGGLRDEGMVPRVFYPKNQAQQLSLFEGKAGYQIEEFIIEED